VGINTALRISDLLQLQVGQFLDEKVSKSRNKSVASAMRLPSTKATEKPSPNIWEIFRMQLKREKTF
jgi:hypothetical protein